MPAIEKLSIDMLFTCNFALNQTLYQVFICSGSDNEFLYLLRSYESQETQSHKIKKSKMLIRRRY